MSNPFNHYKIHKPEPLDLILKYNLNFIEGNIVKYVLRSPFKGDRIGDLKKALFYAHIIEPSAIPVRFPQFDCEKEIQEYTELSVIEKTIISLVINGLKGNRDKEVLIDYVEMAIGDRDHNHKKEELNSKPKIKRFSIHGKFFDTFEEMINYSLDFAELPLDIKEFEKQMSLRVDEAKMNSQNPNFTNRMMYKLLRSYTDWAVENRDTN